MRRSNSPSALSLKKGVGGGSDIPLSVPDAVGDRSKHRPSPGAHTLGRRSLLLAALGIGTFGVSFALVRLSRLAKSPADGPPGMVWVGGGEFTMGTDSDLGWPDEKPAHRVRVDGFWMDDDPACLRAPPVGEDPVRRADGPKGTPRDADSPAPRTDVGPRGAERGSRPPPRGEEVVGGAARPRRGPPHGDGPLGGAFLRPRPLGVVDDDSSPSCPVALLQSRTGRLTSCTRSRGGTPCFQPSHPVNAYPDPPSVPGCLGVAHRGRAGELGRWLLDYH